MKLNLDKKTKILGLTRFEIGLWTFSVIVTFVNFFASGSSIINLAASLVGVTGLIFVAKGAVAGQVLIIIFSVLYGIVSFKERYYGEMITYLCMSAPMAAVSLISWLKHPFKDSGEVEVSSVGAKKGAALAVISTAVTVAVYFILKALDTSSLLVSTISVATSFVAASLTFLRSPYYAIGYALNDVVLIALWVIAAINDPSAWVMVSCFVMFLANDLYGFVSWKRMSARQKALASKNSTPSAIC